MIPRVSVYTRWRINKLITAQGREEIATVVGWKATSHETRNARPDLLLAKNVTSLDLSQSFVRPRAEIKPGKETFVTEDDDFAFTVQLGARDIPTVAIELGRGGGYNWGVCSLIQDPLAMSLTGTGERW